MLLDSGPERSFCVRDLAIKVVLKRLDADGL